MLHFLLIGAAFFALHAWLAPPDSTGTRIVVSQSVVDGLATQYQAVWGQPPTETILANLIDTYVRDEILYREGVALGLDRDDQGIKRRVRQKLEIISEETTVVATPTDADLAGYLARHPGRFSAPGDVTFEQILFDGSAPVSEVNDAVATARRALARGGDPSTLGRPSMLPRRQAATSLNVVARDFGAAFAEELAHAPLGQWTGPLPSSFGPHLVRVTARTPGQLPPLAAVRAQVQREWENDRRTRSLDAAYTRLREGYDVVMPAPRAIKVPAQ
jgi:hypothetical protein